MGLTPTSGAVIGTAARRARGGGVVGAKYPGRDSVVQWYEERNCGLEKKTTPLANAIRDTFQIGVVEGSSALEAFQRGAWSRRGH